MKLMIAYLLIISGIACIAVGSLILVNANTSKSFTSAQESPSAASEERAPVLSAITPAVESSENAALPSSSGREPKAVTPIDEADNIDKNKAIGEQFEKFVVQQFNPAFFKIMEWRGDKFVNGTYASTNHYPDLEIKFKLKSEEATFAVECKYRTSFFKNGISWAAGYQIDNYKEYARRLGYPVFIVIGVGGSPDKPAELFIVPLEDANSTELSKEFLSRYKKNTEKMFFWDNDKKLLK